MMYAHIGNNDDLPEIKLRNFDRDKKMVNVDDVIYIIDKYFCPDDKAILKKMILNLLDQPNI